MAKKILIIGPAWIGDMVMAQPLFMLLKAQDKECVIDVLAPDWSRPLLARMPEVHQSISLSIQHKQLGLYKRYQMAKSLYKEHYQQAIVLPNSFKSALIPYLARIPMRTGWLGEFRYGLLNDLRYLNKDKYPLMIERFLALGLKKEGVLTKPYLEPKLQVDQKTVQKALAKFELVMGKKAILALCPGAEFGPAKRWPETHYAKVAEEFLRRGWQVWLFGSAKDQVNTQKIMQLTKNQCVDLAGKTNLAEAIDLLSVVDKVVSNDSGLMHIANALGRPTVVIYGSSSPSFTPPLNKDAQILKLDLACSPCFKRICPFGHLKCLNDLPAERVIEALASETL
jgi:heptosyltransferase-2